MFLHNVRCFQETGTKAGKELNGDKVKEENMSNLGYS